MRFGSIPPPQGAEPKSRTLTPTYPCTISLHATVSIVSAADRILAVPGEIDFVRWVTARQAAGGLVERAAGDDLAVLRWPAGELLLAGVDQVLDGVHFDSALHSPRRIGRKVMNRNLSDCAAMACLPAAALVAVALPTGAGLDFARELYLGAHEAAAAFDCPIVGGDTASWSHPLAMTVTILGHSDGITPVRRDGARPGDGIFVTGPLGGSILGRHLDFVPRIHLARELARGWTITSMIDISDGLSRDLANLAQASGVAACLKADRVPIYIDARAQRPDGRTPLQRALHDGEDYELLFTAPACDHPAAIRIGSIEAGDGLSIDLDGVRQPLTPLGWEHRL